MINDDSGKGKEMLNSFAIYTPPQLVSLTFKAEIIRDKLRLYEVEYKKTIFGVTYTNKEIALIFGKPPSSGEQLYFDLVDMYLPFKHGLKMVDTVLFKGNAGSGDKVNLTNRLLPVSGALVDIAVPCCVNWREKSEPTKVHPCENISTSTTTARISTSGILGGGKSICTFSMSYEDQEAGSRDVKSLPLTFYMERNVFVNDDEDRTLTELGKRIIEHYKDEDHLFGGAFGGMFLLPMLMPGNSSVIYYAFPNRNSTFSWPKVPATGERDPVLKATARLGDWFNELGAVREDGRRVLGIDRVDALMPVEEWSFIISLQGLHDGIGFP